jgi:hypothetical protein
LPSSSYFESPCGIQNFTSQSLIHCFNGQKKSSELQIFINPLLSAETNFCALQVNFDNVAQKVGIKYGKNARQSFKKIWGKMKGGDATASNGGDAEESDDAESSNKAAVKAATPKKAPGEFSQRALKSSFSYAPNPITLIIFEFIPTQYANF